MKYAFETYDQFLDVNVRNGRTLSRNKAIQIRKLWKEKEIAGEQWWALYVSYSNKREEKGTVNDIFGDVLSFGTYLTNPGALIKVFEENQSIEVDTEDTVEIPKEILEKVKSLGGKTLGSDGDSRYKIRLNGKINWLTYSYIMNRL